MSGKVTLVGAGPGDPGLLTLKGRTALEEAEVVVFDRLVGPEILSMIPPQARRIDVGKEASHHPVPQEDINRILLEEALAGHRVVRLKGGDPVSYTHLDVYKRQLESRGYTGQIATLPGTYTTGRWCYPAAAAIVVSQGLILLAERGSWI